MEEDAFGSLNRRDRDWIRRKVLSALVEAGFDEASMRLDEPFSLTTKEGALEIPIEILACIDRRPALLVKCVKGYTSTRERAAVALARLLAEPPVPFAIVANEKEAVVYDTITGKAVGQGYGGIPRRAEAEQKLQEYDDFRIPSDQRTREQRILETYYHLRCTVEMEPF
jgi:hypothetical protein